MKNDGNIKKQELLSGITTIEEEISEVCANENAEKIRDQVKGFSTLDGGFSVVGMWHVKRK